MIVAMTHACGRQGKRNEAIKPFLGSWSNSDLSFPGDGCCCRGCVIRIARLVNTSESTQSHLHMQGVVGRTTA